MPSNGKWYSAWEDDNDNGDDHENDHLRVDGHDAAEQSMDVSISLEVTLNSAQFMLTQTFSSLAIEVKLRLEVRVTSLKQ